MVAGGGRADRRKRARRGCAPISFSFAPTRARARTKNNALPPRQVCTEHLLLGLIAEDAAAAKGGYFGQAALTLDKARAAVASAEKLGRAVRREMGGEGEVSFHRLLPPFGRGA